jgi:hypothetical protein
MRNQKKFRETALAWPSAARSRGVFCHALRRETIWIAYKGRPAAKPAEPPKAAPTKKPSPEAAPHTPEPAAPKPQEPAKKGH